MRRRGDGCDGVVTAADGVVTAADGVVTADDGVTRCGWGASSQEYRSYHDREWGRPVGDDAAIYERLCLEGFQSGLSWLTILRKREAFRRAFSGFVPATVAGFGDDDVERLLADAGIVRHRAKIVAAVTNARATVALHDRGQSLAALVWGFRPGEDPPPRRRPSEVPARTPESAALAAALRENGFVFVGPTTAYATMQSLGVVNDHFERCHCRAAVEAERASFLLPGG